MQVISFIAHCGLKFCDNTDKTPTSNKPISEKLPCPIEVNF